MNTAWLIEVKGQSHLYWNGSDVSVFTKDPNQAVRFPRREDAERVIRGMQMEEVLPVEHSWVSGLNDAAKEVRYGDDGTIHRTGYVDVEVNDAGSVVSVWFRCHPVPFRQADVGRERSNEMQNMYAKNNFPPVKAIVFANDENPT